MLRQISLLLVLPAMLLCSFVAFAQSDRAAREYEQRREHVKRLRKMADSIKREAHKIEQEVSKYAAKLSDSLSLWSKKYTDSLTNWAKDLFPDSLFKKFQFDSRQFFIPDENKQWNIPSYPYLRYFNDPDFRGLPLPDIEPRNDERNKQPAPRVIPKHRDGIDIPNFPGWRFEKLKNYTMVL